MLRARGEGGERGQGAPFSASLPPSLPPSLFRSCCCCCCACFPRILRGAKGVVCVCVCVCVWGGGRVRVRGREHAHVRGSEIGRNMRNGRTQSWRTREQLEDGRITTAAPCTLRVYHLLFGCLQSSASMMGGGTMNSGVQRTPVVRRALLRNDFALRGAAFIRPVRPSPTNMPRERALLRFSSSSCDSPFPFPFPLE